ncbi:MAG: hypothetical protein GKS06_19545 [Acidobacteria bacterium]|nr:hypothetical protein [Acidobacteriota bacterium]
MRDEQLEERFRAMRESDLDYVPDFERTLASARNRDANTRGANWGWGAIAAAMPAMGVIALVLGGLETSAPERASEPTLETWSSPTTGLVADLGTLEDPLAALESFQSPTAALLELDDRRTP